MDFKKAAKAPTFSLDVVDWDDIKAAPTAAAKKVYNAIDWSNTPISSDVARNLDYSLINFSKFDPSKLQDINDLAFETLGNNYKKLNWAEIDYSALNPNSKVEIKWEQVDFKKAAKAPTFSLDVVDWAEVSANSKALKLAEATFKSEIGQALLTDATPDALTGLDPKAILGSRFSPENNLIRLGETNYAIVTAFATYHQARAASYALGGKLADLEDPAESTLIKDAITGLLDSNPALNKLLSRSVAKDGGGAPYLWLGGSDASAEGNWQWDSPDSQSNAAIGLDRSDWGAAEPDNFDGLDPSGQDYLALGLTNWPKGALGDQAYGNAGQWNDISGQNKLAFLVEF